MTRYEVTAKVIANGKLATVVESSSDYFKIRYVNGSVRVFNYANIIQHEIAEIFSEFPKHK